MLKHRVIFAVVFVILALSLMARAADEKAKPGYLVIAPKTAMPALKPLLDLRAQRYTVSTITMESLAAGDGTAVNPDAIARAIRERAKGGGLAYVLFVGDTRDGEGGFKAVPTHPVGFDAWYAFQAAEKPDAPSISIGRFPARNVDELKTMVAKTVAYETDRRPGPWQRRIHVVAGTGGYGPELDTLIDAVGAAILGGLVPQTYDVTMTRGMTSSPYCWPPQAFENQVVRLFDDGPLFVVYIGHGSATTAMPVTGFARAKMFDSATMRKLRCAPGRTPVAMFIACDMGRFDGRQECVAEAAVRAPGGPVACLASLRQSHPYGNAVFGLELCRVLLAGGRATTIGEGMLGMQQRLLAPPSPFDLTRRLVDRLAPLDDAEKRREAAKHASLYALLGDPALPVAYAVGAVGDLCVERDADGRLHVAGTTAPVARGKALVTLELTRTAMAGPLKDVAHGTEGWEKRMEDNYRAANAKVLQEATLEVTAGRFEAVLPGPETKEMPPGGFWLVKVFAWDDARAVSGVAMLRPPAAP